MVSPQGRLDDPWRYGRNADSEQLVELGHRPDKAVDTVFGGNVNRGGKCGVLTGDTGDMDNMLGLLAGSMTEEMRNGQLGGPDWVGQVDVYQGVSAACGRIATRG